MAEMIKAKDMKVGCWYEAYGMTVECLGTMSDGKYMLVAIDGDKDMQSQEGWPLDKDVMPVENPYK
jgi:hypothetical protein